ncbi:MAG: hypothetical protein NXI21_10245 [Alphaproteobacteria bacterium]|nr:hypothetical protein [Alphaproteobacteria bacterium]
MKTLPYSARTASGDVYDVEFPLHADTVSPVRVGQLVSTILEAVERDMALAGETSNGDVLQAVAMAAAIRARMIHAPPAVTGAIARDLMEQALEAAERAAHRPAASGRA